MPDNFYHALQYHSSGELTQAESLYRAALAENTDLLAVAVYYGLLLCEMDRQVEAFAQFDRVVTAKEHRHSALIDTIGNINVTPEVEQKRDQLVELFFNVATVAFQKGDLSQAMQYFCYASILRPDIAAIHLNLGETHRRLGKLDEAADDLNRALRLVPDSAEAHYNLAKVCKEQKRYQQAVNAYQAALAIKPDLVDAMYNLANLLADLGQLQQACNYYQRAIDGESSLKKFDKAALSNIYNNYGNTLLLLDYIPQAEKIILAGLAINPEHVGLLSNYSRVLLQLDRDVECRAVLEKALALGATAYQIHFTLAALALKSGNLKEALNQLEFRHNTRLTDLPMPNWQSARQSQLLVADEQGVGDQMRYSWFITHLSDEPLVDATVLCDDRLVNIFSRSFPDISIVGKMAWRKQNTSLTEKTYDAEISIASLASRYYEKMEQRYHEYCSNSGDVVSNKKNATKPSTISNFGGGISAHLRADKDRVAYWRNCFVQTSGNAQHGNLIVGFCWRSPVDMLGHFLRFPPLELFKPLYQNKPITWVNLQHAPTEEEQALLAEWIPPQQLIPLTEIDKKDDFDEVAAILSAIDLLITPATAMKEFAGCLGIHTWVYKTSSEVDWAYLPRFFYGIQHCIKVYDKKGFEPWENIVKQLSEDLDVLANSVKNGSAND